ncbi:MAG: DUF917 family protein [Candidatus Daviesbacteria bacterium]|nr:DUF917 family protein [Candidatus Daviesbacteria bacterium]
MKIINQHLAKQLIKGASILTTGGGVPPVEQRKALKIFTNLQVKLVSLDELPADGYLCMAGELGPSEVPPLDKRKIINKMIKLLSEISAKKIVGFYPPEIGQESVTLESAHLTGLPVVDLDPVGGRAVPFLDLSVFNLRKIPYSLTPLVVSTDKEELLTINGTLKLERVEQMVRELTKLSSSGLVFLIGGLISVEQLKKAKIENNSYSLALQLGTIKTIEELKTHLKPRLIIEAVVQKITRLDKQGFSASKVIVLDRIKNSYQLTILNEALFIHNQQGDIIASVPERILLVNPQTLGGFPSSELDKGQAVIILVVRPDKLWQTARAKKIFGKERFSFLLSPTKHGEKIPRA